MQAGLARACEQTAFETSSTPQQGSPGGVEMTKDRAILRQRAARIYARLAAMWYEDEEEDWPERRPRCELLGARRFGRYDRDWQCDPRHNPDLILERRLAEAEFEVLHDTGPEGEAFRLGARLTYVEVEYMLRHEVLLVNSVLVHVESGRRHLVLRGRNHHLVLEPPYAPERKTS
jgi:hypothetical protein